MAASGTARVASPQARPNADSRERFAVAVAVTTARADEHLGRWIDEAAASFNIQLTMISKLSGCQTPDGLTAFCWGCS
jgi:hypothetical protein